MTGDEGREVFEAIVPQEEMDRLCQPCGVSERQRQRNLGMFGRAMVISAGTPGGAYQADVWRSYVECEVPHVARSACSQWFDEPLERCMAALAEQALADARAQQVDLAGPRGGVQDWPSVAAPTVPVRAALREALPGTGDAAAVTGHTGLSVGGGAPVRDQCSPAREHDRRHLSLDESWRGDGLLADLASARLDRRRAWDAHGVRCVSRLTEDWKPQVDDLARGQITQACFPGSDCEALLEQEMLLLDGRVIDADGPIGQDRQALPRRRVGVQPPKGYGCFLTTLPPRRGPRQVADRSRVRWEVALSIRLDQSVNRLEAIDAERPCSLKTLWHASRLASTLAARRAPTHNVHTRPQQPGAPRPHAPLHPRRLALQLGVSCQAIAHAFELTGAEATQRWNTMAAWLTPSGRDPNWRRRPSVLAQRRGWKRQPMTRQKPSSGDGSPCHFKAAASVDTYASWGFCFL